MKVMFDNGNDFNVKFHKTDNVAVGFDRLGPKDYYGSYTVTPTDDTQTIPTANKILLQNIIVEPIPSNYGKITWNGAVMTIT